LGTLDVQLLGDSIQIGVEQVRVHPQRHRRICVPQHPRANTFTPALIANEAQVWRKSWGVMACTPARFTAARNHPVFVDRAK
jgi:hypothetical protein